MNRHHVKCGTAYKHEESQPSGESDWYPPGYWTLQTKVFSACLAELNRYIAAIYYAIDNRPAMPVSDLKDLRRRMQLIQELMYLKPQISSG